MRLRTVFWTNGASVAHIMAEGCTPENASTGYDYLLFQTACGRSVRVKLLEVDKGRPTYDVIECCKRKEFDLDKLRPDGHYGLTIEEAEGIRRVPLSAYLCKRCFQREVVKYGEEEHCI